MATIHEAVSDVAVAAEGAVSVAEEPVAEVGAQNDGRHPRRWHTTQEISFLRFIQPLRFYFMYRENCIQKNKQTNCSAVGQCET